MSIKSEKEHSLSKLFEIPATVLPNVFQLEMNGNREAVLVGSSGISLYSEECIRVVAKKMFITFRGRNLQIKAMSDDNIIVVGYITAIEFGE